MERTPTTIRPGLTPRGQTSWLALPATVTRPGEEPDSPAESPAPLDSPEKVATASRADARDRTFLTAVANHARKAAVITLAVAALALLAVPVVIAYVNLTSLPAESTGASNGATPQSAELLVWIQCLGACLALVLYYEGEWLQALVRRIVRAVSGRLGTR